jgi:hypothetical protein
MLMEFEELKVVWSAQGEAPLFTLREADLHAVVKRRMDETSRSAACRFRVEIAISVIAATAMLGLATYLLFGRAGWVPAFAWPKVPASGLDIAALTVAGGVWLYFAAYMSQARNRLVRCGEHFESSLRGDIDRALEQVQFQIKVATDIVWRGFVPVYAAVSLWVFVVFRLSAGPLRVDFLKTSYLVAYALMVAAFIADAGCRRKAIRERFEPQRRELQSLRGKLTNAKA